MDRKGYLVFHGGDAFTAENRDTDRVWLKPLRKQQHNPRLIVIPAAEINKPELLADRAARYLETLGTYAEYRVIIDPLTANTRTEYEILNTVEGAVLIDGSPFDIVERVRDTHTHEALARGLAERTMAVVGVGASAMAMGAVYWLDNTWLPGLALAPDLAILPRHNFARMRYEPARLLAELPQGITLIGVDERTIVIAHPNGLYEVAGIGEVSVYRSANRVDDYRAGQRFRLDAPVPDNPPPDPAE